MSVVVTKDVRKDQRYQIDIRVPNARGELAPAAAGALTGIKLALSASKGGAAIHANVDNLSATETPEVASRFYVDLDTSLAVTHLLPLGVGSSYWAVWSKAGDMTKQSVEFKVGDGTVAQ